MQLIVITLVVLDVVEAMNHSHLCYKVCIYLPEMPIDFTLFLSVRSSRPEVFCKKGVLKNFPKFTGKHLCQSLLFLASFSVTYSAAEGYSESHYQTSKVELCVKIISTIFTETSIGDA